MDRMQYYTDWKVEGMDALTAFNKGWDAALAEIERQRAFKSQVNAGGKPLNPFKFVRDCGERRFMQGVFHADGRQVATNGRFCLVHNNTEYDKGYEGKIVDGEGDLIEGDFPNYRRVMPYDIDRFTLDEARGQGKWRIEDWRAPSLEDLNGILAPYKRTRRESVLERNFIRFVSGDWRERQSVGTLLAVRDFLAAYPDARAYRSQWDNLNGGATTLNFLYDAKTRDILVYVFANIYDGSQDADDFIYDIDAHKYTRLGVVRK